MKASLYIKNYIKSKESLRLYMYDDPGGNDPGKYDTIGWGHFLSPGESYPNGITIDQAEALFNSDIKIAEDAVNNYVTVPLNQNQFDALVSWVYNCGVTAFKNSKMRRLINSMSSKDSIYNRWTTTYITNNGVKLNGLVKRRKFEADLFFSNANWSSQPVNSGFSVAFMLLSLIVVFALFKIFT